MDHIMIDLETLGTKPASPIIAIGAVFFDPATGQLGEDYYAKIDPVSALEYSRIAGDTFVWWMQQSDAARAEVTGGTMRAEDVFNDFNQFVSVNANLGKLKPWGNGATFDITMMEVSFERIARRPPPWKFWNVRDVRTIKELGELVGPKYPHQLKGTAHNAIDDAKHQARFVSWYWQCLCGRKPNDPFAVADGKDDFADFDTTPQDSAPETSDLDDLLG